MSLPNTLQAKGSSLGAFVTLKISGEQVGNDNGGGDTVLDSYTLPADLLGDDGDSVGFEYSGAMAGAANSRVRVKFGGSTIIDTDVIDPAPVSWVIYGRIIRTASGHQKTTGWIGALGVGAFGINSITEDTTGPLELQVIGNGPGASDVTLETSFVYAIAARP